MEQRLDALSRAELLELAAAGCSASSQVKNSADALIAKRKPLPAWCTDVILSADLLSHALFEESPLSDSHLALVCSQWAASWSVVLRRRRYVHPVPRRVMALPDITNGMAGLPDGSILLRNFGPGAGPLRFCSSDGVEQGTDGPWAALTVHELRNPTGGLLHGGVLYVGEPDEPSTVRRLRVSDGAEINRSKPISLEGARDSSCIAHDANFALVGDRLYVLKEESVCVFDAETLALRQEFGRGAAGGTRLPRGLEDTAPCARACCAPKGSGRSCAPRSAA